MIPLKPLPAGVSPHHLAPHRAVDGRARLGWLLQAPHRLGIFAGATMLALAALWWGAMLASRCSSAASRC